MESDFSENLVISDVRSCRFSLLYLFRKAGEKEMAAKPGVSGSHHQGDCLNTGRKTCLGEA